jgi:NAD(P)-dependent dehydrogenase (short-subunit alcohol dehydrogenase family)
MSSPASPVPHRLEGKRALVSGASRGIGRAIAMRLAAEGACVAVGCRKPDDGDAVKTEIEKQGGKAICVLLDVTDAASVATAVERAARPDRRLDIVVNNAGVGGPTPLDGDERSDRHFQRILDVNLGGTWRVCRAALPFLHPGARIVNLSSVLGRFGVPAFGGYCAAKTGIIGLTRALATELGPRGITVNAICPGWVDTEMARAGIHLNAVAQGISDEDAFVQAGKMAPLGRVLEPWEIGGLVAYLASDDARNVTGQAIVVDGGQVMP